MRFSEISIRLLVNDFAACFDFYTEKMGLTVFWGDRNGPFASFTVDGMDKPCISIFEAKYQTIYQGYVPPAGTGRTDQAIYVIPTDDVDGDYETLKSRGVAFIGEPQTVDAWYMRCVYLRDPEGNLIELSREIG